MAEVTIQKTRKRIKVQQPFAIATLGLGIGLCMIAGQSERTPTADMTMANGVLTIVGGFVWMAGLRVARWWFHD